MEPAWDNPRLKKYAAVLVARLERPRLPERPPTRGQRAAEWLLGRAARAEAGDAPIRARFDASTGDIAAWLKSALMECQKPFQLWNVNRIEESGPVRFEKVPRYVVGVLEKADRSGIPGRVVPASRMLRGANEEVELARSEAFGARRRLRRLLEESAEEQGLGVPDEG